MDSDTAVHAHSPIALTQGQMTCQRRGSGPSSAPWGAIVRMALSQAFLASCGSGPSSAPWGAIVRMDFTARPACADLSCQVCACGVRNLFVV